MELVRLLFLVLLLSSLTFCFAEEAVNTKNDSAKEEKSKDEEKDDKSEIVLTIMLTLICLFVGRLYDGLKERYHFVERRLKLLSSTTVYILTGFLIGLFAVIIGEYDDDGPFAFREEIFDTFILPPILFNAGFSLKLSYLRHNWKVVVLFTLTFVFIGKLLLQVLIWFIWPEIQPDYISESNAVNAALVASLLVMEAGAFTEAFQERLHLEEAHEPPPILPLLSVLAVFSAVDSVVAFDEIKKIIDGEHELSWMNNTGGDLEFWEITFLMLAWSLVALLVGSLLGVVVGLVSALYFRIIGKLNPHEVPNAESIAAELAGMLFFGYGLFFLSEFLSEHWMIDTPGSIAVFTCGIVMGQFTWFNVGGISRTVFPYIVRSFAVIGEVYTYGVIGSTFWALAKNDFTGKTFLAALVVYLLMWATRVVMALLSIPIANKLSRPSKHWETRFKWKDAFSLGWGSTMLGHVAYGLAADTEESLNENLEPILWLLVAFTAVVQGSLSEYAIGLFGWIPGLKDVPEDSKTDGGGTGEPTPTHTACGSGPVGKFTRKLRAHEVSHFNRQYHRQFSRYVMLGIDSAFHSEHHGHIPAAPKNPYKVNIASPHHKVSARPSIPKEGEESETGEGSESEHHHGADHNPPAGGLDCSSGNRPPPYCGDAEFGGPPTGAVLQIADPQANPVADHVAELPVDQPFMQPDPLTSNLAPVERLQEPVLTQSLQSDPVKHAYDNYGSVEGTPDNTPNGAFGTAEPNLQPSSLVYHAHSED